MLTCSEGARVVDVGISDVICSAERPLSQH